MTRAFSLPALTLIAMPFVAETASSQSATESAAISHRSSVASLAFATDTRQMPTMFRTLLPADTVLANLPPIPHQEAHDGNYAIPGAIIGAVVTGTLSAVLMGKYAKRNCRPGFCSSDFERGALVGGSVGIAGGGVLGWIVGSSIARVRH